MPACGRGVPRFLQLPLLALSLAALALAADAPAPTCALVPGWSQSGPARSYEAANLFEYMDGNAEGYLIYGFRNMVGVSCHQAEISFVIDVSDMGDADSAYGLFSGNRDPSQPVSPIGVSAQVTPRRAMFVKGKYYVEIAANQENVRLIVGQLPLNAARGRVGLGILRRSLLLGVLDCDLALDLRRTVEGKPEYFCTVYEQRPQTCRDLERGSAQCAGECMAKRGRVTRLMA